MEAEIWRDIPGFVDKYMVSNKGRVMNSQNGRIMKPSLARKYPTVVLSNGSSKHRTASVHALVALAFLGERPLDEIGQPCVVNHKDGNKENNTIENLEYLSTGENTIHYHSVLKPQRKDAPKTGSTKNYNSLIFHVGNPDERDQCQFVYPPSNGDKPTRCQRDGMYRIGQVIFLCGIHTPGVGKNAEVDPVSAEGTNPPTRTGGPSLFARMQRFFEANPGKVISYRQIMDMFPNMRSRDYISGIVCRLRKERGMRILTVTRIGYRYMGSAEDCA